MSIILIIIASTLPPNSPLIAPTRVPMNIDTIMESTPTIKEIRAPYKALVK